MIGIYNETSLHNELKSLYARQTGGKTEVKTGDFICDVVTAENNIIEIQTAHLSSLKKKLEYLLQSHNVKIVFPLAKTVYIELYDEKNKLLHRRKSPKKQTIYSIYRELTGIYPLLKHPRLSIEVLETIQTDVRVRTETPVQVKNNSRRFKKNWYKTDKRLESTIDSILFSCSTDYARPLLTLLEVFFEFDTPNKTFSVPELAKTAAGRNAQVFVWVLKKMELIIENGKKGNTKLYILSPELQNK